MVRLLVRVVFLAAILTAASFVPMLPQASAKLSQKAILIEANDALPGFQKVVDLGVGAEMVGFTWRGETSATIDVRGLVGGAWTEWMSLDGSPDEGPDRSSREHHPQVFAGPTWLGHNVGTIELKVTSGLAHYLQVHAVDTEPAPRPKIGVKPAGAETPLPFVATRAQWGANEGLRSTGPEYAEKIEYAVVHHTVNSNSYAPSDSPALIRGIYLFHTQVNGWSDIGYNFLIDRFGQVFEGRFGGINQPVIGGHAGGFNGRSTGVSLIGDFTSTPVPAPAYQSLRKLLAWKLAYHHVNPLGTVQRTVSDSDCNCQNFPPGTTVTIPTISGHRDLDQTGCPGQFMYDLIAQLRNDVAMDIGNQGPAQWMCQWDVNNDFGAGTTSPLPGRTDTFIRWTDGRLLQEVQTADNSSGWMNVGGFLTSDPDATTRGPNQPDVYVRGSNGVLWHRWFNGLTWMPWENLGGQLASAPSAVSWGAGHVAVFGCGMDSALWMRTFNGSWGPWTSLGGRLMSAPEASSDGANRLDVVVRGIERAMYRMSFRNGAWTPWEAIGGEATSGAGMASWGPNRIDLAVRGLEGQVWANAWLGSSWGGWYPLGGRITSDPDVTSTGPNQLTITAKGTDGWYWQRSYDGNQWQPWVHA